MRKFKNILSILLVLAIFAVTMFIIPVSASTTVITGKSLGLSYTGGWDTPDTYAYIDETTASVVVNNKLDDTYVSQLQVWKDLKGMSNLLTEIQKHDGAKIAIDIMPEFETGGVKQCYFQMIWQTGGKWTGIFDNVLVSGEQYTILFDVSDLPATTPTAIQLQFNNYHNWATGIKNGSYTVSLPYIYMGDAPTTSPRLTEGATLPPETVSNINYGDVNSDSAVNSKDSLQLKKYIASWDVAIDTAAADTNADGAINSKDSLLLKQFLANWDVVLGVKTQPTTTTTTTMTTTPPTVTTTTTGGTYMGMRDITSTELMKEITLGINIGNSLDSCGMGTSASVYTAETFWGNPQITEDLIKAYKAAGFNAIRLPVTWRDHLGSAPDYTINKAWMDRVEQVVKMILDNGMYCILNTHHEQNWLNTNSTTYATTAVKASAVWSQIANRFKDYNDYLLLEGFNEILHSEGNWSSPSPTDIANCNKLAQLFVDTVRATGGNNSVRDLIVSTYGAEIGIGVADEFVVPTDTVANRLVVEVHLYNPNSFSFKGGVSTWGTAYEKSQLNSIIDSVDEYFVQKGYPVIIGEFGTVNKDNTAARTDYCATLVSRATQYGIKCFYWDNGNNGSDGFGLFDRRTYASFYPEIVTAMLNATK